MKTLPEQNVLGVRVHALTLHQVLEIVDETIRDRGHLLLGVVNAAKIVNMRRDAALGESVRSADIVLADGMPVVWASRLLRRPLPERVAGIDLMEGMLERGRQHGYRVFCLGATDEVLEAAVASMRERHPGVEIVGQQNGYFGPDEEAAVAEHIRAARPDILLVAMTSPKKEGFLARWSAHMDVPVCHGVGGSFDVLAGKVRRAPVRWQRLGLEWLYRVLQEPRRMWRRYLVTNTVFCALVLREFFSGRGPAQPDTVPVSSK